MPSPRRARLRAPTRLPVPWFDAVLAAGLALSGLVSTRADAGVPHPWAELLAALSMAFLGVRTRWPLVMAVGTSLSFVAFALCRGTSTPMWAFVGILVVGFSTGAQLRGRRRVLALVVEVAATYVVQLLTAARLVDQLTWAETYLTPPLIILAPAMAGALLQRSRDHTARIAQLARQLELEREQHVEAAAIAERNRIARELHDVISHSVSVMVVQAGAAEELLPEGSPALEPVQVLRRTGKEALGELRRQLGVLGTGEDGAAPLPGLADLPRLVATAGGTLEWSGTGDAPLAGGLEVAVYRVVQEALTNTTRHASGSVPHVRVVQRGGGLEVEVTDPGGPPSGQVGSGRGLVGMTERVDMYGGVLSAGPHHGGWRVHAWFPVAPAPADRSAVPAEVEPA